MTARDTFAALLAVSLLASTSTAGELLFEGGGERLAVPATSVTDVAVQDVGQGLSQLDLALSEDAAERFGDMTGRLVGEQLIMSVCGIVVASPHVMEPITGGRIAMTGGHEMMADVALALTSAKECADIGS